MAVSGKEEVIDSIINVAAPRHAVRGWDRLGRWEAVEGSKTPPEPCEDVRLES